MDDLFNLEFKISEGERPTAQPSTRYYCPTYTPVPTGSCSEYCPSAYKVCTYPRSKTCMIAANNREGK